MSQIKENLEQIPLLSVALVVSVLAFLVKGISYLIIGSSIPFLLGMIILVLIVFSLTRRNRFSRRIFRFWGWLLIFWGISRLAVEIMFMLASVTEEHIQNQFTIGQRLLSMGAIIFGVYIIRKVRFYREATT
ncbi:hypothetical protein [Ekhidna sp.]|uniref:hypothetical protein n=1 Tax=Ekhidna sp. TaxID=2608089 RepID=UPI003B5C0301